jgi:glycosyltransferase involved in cell wall biosynthesis
MPGIVMLVNEFPPLPVGGAERQAERLSADLAARGWRVWVLTRSAPGLPARETRQGFEILRPAAWGPGKLRTISFVLGALWQLWRLRGEYGLLHAHLAFGPAFAAVLAARLLGKRSLVKLGNSGEYGDLHVSLKTGRGRLRMSVFRRWADKIIVLDEVMQAEALAAGFDPQRVQRMANGIDPQAFLPLNSRSAAQAALGLAGKVVVLSMGRLTAQKSLPTLFQAVAEASQTCPNLHLLILGDGPDRAQLETLVASLQLQAQVTFAGNQADVRPYLSAADLFALPSASEGISNALLEAMAAGLACLATPVGGSPEVLDHGRVGRLLPVGDVSAWSRALVELGQSAPAREALGQAARERIAAEYTFTVVGARYAALYTELLAAPAPFGQTLVETK